jgi:drug/metabolite transporter (DMT)-like permease
MRLAFVSMIFAVICQSLTYGFLSGASSNDILLLVSFGFFLSAMVYQLIAIFQGQPLTKNARPVLLVLNISTALAFLSFYVALYFIPASLASLIEAAAGPLLMILLIYLKNIKSSARPSGLALWLNVGILLCGYLALSLERHGLWTATEWVGIACACLAALGACLIAIQSKTTAAMGLSAVSVLSWRLHLTWLLALSLYFWQGGSLTLAALLNMKTLALALVGIVFPMYLLQRSMQNLPPLFSMIALSFIPLFSYLVEFYLGKASHIGVFFLLLLSLVLGFVQLKKSSVTH